MNNIPTVKCKWCGTQTPHIGTKSCDMCWELSSRIPHNLAATAKILLAMPSAKLALFKQLLNLPRTALIERGEPLYPAAEAMEELRKER